MGKIYVKDRYVTSRRSTVRVRVESTTPPPRRAKIKIIYDGGEVTVEGVLVSSYRSDKFIAYYDIYAKYREIIKEIVDKVRDVELVGDAEGQ